MPKKTFFIALLLLALITSPGQAKDQSVRIWQQPLVIPTYRLDTPDSNPMFYDGQAYQGAKKKIYPYPFQDKLTDIREDKTYNAVYLENRYLKISFLPELGGRLFSALDKTNNYDFFYRQHVIKPALIGMLGAWISGGIEWCVLHHHRATTFMPVDYTLAENPDGSKTLWFGEIERRHRMKWIIAATLHPDKSYLEVTVKIFNRTPFPNSFLYWANVAVHANDDYQVIFPPSTQFATYHAKNDFTHWPISNETYRRVDYSGVDLSWWKNHPKPISFFAWDLKEDFSGGYDHGKKAGVIHIGNHHILTGSKLWEWSPGPGGRMWDRILTETDGPYAELMVGAYSDNQPDYSWIKPYEVKTFTQHWYPIRKIGSVKKANLNAVLNLEITPQNLAKIGFNTTSQYPNAKVLLTACDKVILEKKINIGPDKPFTKEITLPQAIKETDLQLSLFSSTNEKLICYRPAEKKYDPNLPEVVKEPPAPKDIETVEQLYLTGLRLEQMHNPTLDALPYYQEALARDPGNSQANTALGIHYNKRAMFKEAEEKLTTAIERISYNYTRPRDNEAYYQLGLALRGRKKYDEAYDAFYRATWDYTFHSPAYYQLAEISCLKGNFNQALEQIERCLSTDTLNTKALNTKAVTLRKLEKLDEAKKTVSKVLDIDPLDFWALNELYRLESAGGPKNNVVEILSDFETKIRGQVQSYLELAVDYINLGCWPEAVDVLSRAVATDKELFRTYPLVYYCLGYLSQKQGDTANVSKYYALAAKMPPDYCFPFRAESIDILNSAIQQNPLDARAYYYLGNLLYDIQPENAVKAWEKSAQIDSSFATVHRNLGWAYQRTEDNKKAIASYEKAIACDSKDPRLYAELDVLYEAASTSPQTRLALLQKNHETVVQRDDSFLREIMLLVQVKQYDKAVEFLKNRHFHSSEGSDEVHDVYFDACLLRGIKNFQNKKYRQALEDFIAAGQYPENLEVGRPKNDPGAPQVNYFIATAYQALGDNEKAQEFYLKTSQQKSDRPQTRYYQALTFAQLGEKEKAKQIFDRLITTGSDMLTEDTSGDFFAKFGGRQARNVRLANAHYIIGLGHLGNGQKQKAKNNFARAIDLNINHIWANFEFSQLK